MENSYGPSWMEVSLDVLAENTRRVQSFVKEKNKATKVLAVVKADGYGHGAVEVARTMEKEDVDYFGVATVFEGLELRKAGITKPILVFAYTPASHYSIAIRRDLTLTIYTEEMGLELARIGQRIKRRPKVHIKLDVGMTRLGFQLNQGSAEVIKRIVQMDLSVEGIYGHFPLADSEDKSHTMLQGMAFKTFIEDLKTEGVDFDIIHLCNSAAMMELPEFYFDMVRAGGILYGHFCLGHYYDKPIIPVEQAMTIRAILSNINQVGPDTGVSYGWFYKTEDQQSIGTLPIGYADGVSRRNTNNAEFLLRGKRVKQVGLICMDQMMVDVTNVPECQIGDVVTLLGQDGEERITLNERAKSASIGKAELFASIGRRMPKVYFEQGLEKGYKNYLWDE